MANPGSGKEPARLTKQPPGGTPSGVDDWDQNESYEEARATSENGSRGGEGEESGTSGGNSKHSRRLNVSNTSLNGISDSEEETWENHVVAPEPYEDVEVDVTIPVRGKRELLPTWLTLERTVPKLRAMLTKLDYVLQDVNDRDFVNVERLHAHVSRMHATFQDCIDELSKFEMAKQGSDNIAYFERISSWDALSEECSRIIVEAASRMKHLQLSNKAAKMRSRRERKQRELNESKEVAQAQEQAILDALKKRQDLERQASQKQLEEKLAFEEKAKAEELRVQEALAKQHAEQEERKQKLAIDREKAELEREKTHLDVLKKEAELEDLRMRRITLQNETGVSTSGTTEYATSSTSYAVGKLPKLTITPYDGNPIEWQSFHDRFKSQVLDQPRYSKVVKFGYLFEFTTGRAKDTISGISLTNENFDEAWDLLEKTFGDKEKVKNEHQRALRDLPIAKSHTESLRKTFNEMERHIRSLKALGEPIDTNSTLFAILVQKFPTFVLIELKMKAQTYKVTYNLKFFREEVKNLIEAREYAYGIGASSQMSGGNAEHKGNDDNSGRKGRPNFNANRRNGQYGLYANGSSGSGQQSKTPKCVFCDGSHWGDSCRAYPTLDTRRKRLQDLRKCFVCLDTGHLAKNCEKSPFCKHCKKNTKHYRSLCRLLFQDGGNVQNRHVHLVEPKTEYDQTKPPAGDREETVHNGLAMNLAFHSQDYSVPSTEEQTKMHVYKTVVTDVYNPETGVSRKVRILFDSGAGSSYITETCARELNLSTIRNEFLNIFLFSKTSTVRKPSRKVQILLKPPKGEQHTLELNTIDVITSNTERPSIPPLPDFVDQSKLADKGEELGENSTIDLMIGCEHDGLFITGNPIPVGKNLWMVDSSFGYLLSGVYYAAGKASREERATLAMFTDKYPCTDAILEEALPTIETFTSLETIGIRDDPKFSEDDEAIRQFNEHTTFNQETGRYSVPLPWRRDPKELPENKELAKGRLKSLLNRLSKEPERLKQYDAVFKEQLEMGIIEEVPQDQIDTSNPTHYLCHHGVYSDSKSTKLRVVYDGGCKSKPSNLSLNDCLYRGPLWMNDLTGILMRSRTRPILIVSDLAKAFLMMELREQDRDLVRFLWVKDPTKPLTDDIIIIYRFRRVLFGLKPSPWLLHATLTFHLNQYAGEIAELLKEWTYVDNPVTPVYTVDEGLLFYHQGKAIMAAGGWNLRQFDSNSKEFLSHLPENDLVPGGSKSVLGLGWDRDQDIFYPVNHYDGVDLQARTKRDVLRLISMNFDPFGITNPCLLPHKLFMQNLWKVPNLGWDTTLSTVDQETWMKLAKCLPQVSRVAIPRYVGIPPEDDQTISYELICFSDSSKMAYAACVYLRVTASKNGEEHFRVSILFSKARLGPIDGLSLPRMELLGMVVGSRMLTFCEEQLKLPIIRKFLFSDSACCLQWIKSANRQPLFVENRLKELKSSKNTEFRYVNTTENPSDIATRGLEPELLKESKFWLNGPEWLSKPAKSWPTWGAENLTSEPRVLLAKISHLNRKERSHYLDESKIGPAEINPYRTSNMMSLLKRTAFVMRVVEIWKKKKRNVNRKKKANVSDVEPATTKEILCARMLWERSVQKLHFSEVLTALKDGKHHCLINSLGLKLNENGLIVIPGRLENAELSDSAKSPVLLPSHGVFTKLAIEEVHHQLMHSGVEHVLLRIRQRYWIPKGRQVVRSTLRKCLKCKRVQGGHYQLPPFHAYPRERVRQAKPFENCSVDYAGPCLVRENGDERKAWICLFVCLVTRALHLELVLDNTTEEFLRALRRFVSRRGVPRKMLSDNAKTFKKGDKLMRVIWNQKRQDLQVQEYLAAHSIQWEFVPELSPWAAGVYERMVGLVKSCLRKTLDKEILSSWEFYTVLTECEQVVNSRPLIYIGTDINDGHSLSPTHFLTWNTQTDLPETLDFDDNFERKLSSDSQLLSLWNYGKKRVNFFWKLWRNAYLQSLREQGKWCHPKKGKLALVEPKLGEIVLIKDPKQPRSLWRLGQIVELKRSRDNRVRTAVVRSAKGTLFTRSISLLFPLEVGLEDTSEEPVTKPSAELPKRKLPKRAAAEQAKRELDWLLREGYI